MTDTPESIGNKLGIPWPDVPRLCFGPGEDWRLDANVPWVQAQKDIYPYAEGYRRAAVVLLDSMPEIEQNPDFLLWPLAFLWRHHIELMLKDIIGKGRLLEHQDAGFPEHHRLVDLWREAKAHIARCGSDDAPELVHVETAIVEFQRVDPGATGFRYPFARKDGGPSLPDAPECINLRALQTTMEGLANFFDCVCAELEMRLDLMNEMEAQHR